MLLGNANFRIQSEISAAISTLTAEVRRNLAGNCCCAFFERNCFFSKLVGLEVSATFPGLSPVRWDRKAFFEKEN